MTRSVVSLLGAFGLVGVVWRWSHDRQRFPWRAVAWGLETQFLFGRVNAPLAWLMGVPAKDCGVPGQVLGERIVLNEFVGALSLAKLRAHLDERSFVLATYALCGLANFGSIAIQIGSIGALVPQPRAELARLGARTMQGGQLARSLTATAEGCAFDGVSRA
jgi:CNT family concentrative nucleoside transporter